MSEILNVSINCDKIDKSKIFAGKKGNYLDLTLIPTPDNKYGSSHMVVQSSSKEDRAKGIKGEILGNATPPKAASPEEGDYERQRANEDRAPATDPADCPF